MTVRYRIVPLGQIGIYEVHKHYFGSEPVASFASYAEAHQFVVEKERNDRTKQHRMALACQSTP